MDQLARIFIAKYRSKILYGELRRYRGQVLSRLAEQRESEAPAIAIAVVATGC